MGRRKGIPENIEELPLWRQIVSFVDRQRRVSLDAAAFSERVHHRYGDDAASSAGRRSAVELIMAEPTVRERILQALEDLPTDATFDDAIERLVFLAKIDAGLAELDAGKGIPHDEAKRQLGL